MEPRRGAATEASAIPVVASGQPLVAAHPAGPRQPPVATPDRAATGELRPHKAPPLNVSSTPLTSVAAFLTQAQAGPGEGSLTNDRRAPTITPRWSHAPSRPYGT